MLGSLLLTLMFQVGAHDILGFSPSSYGLSANVASDAGFGAAIEADEA
jgi:hypothetical protein